MFDIRTVFAIILVAAALITIGFGAGVWYLTMHLVDKEFDDDKHVASYRPNNGTKATNSK